MQGTDQDCTLRNSLQVRQHSHKEFLAVLRLLCESSSASTQSFCSVPFTVFNGCEETSAHSTRNPDITTVRGISISDPVANVSSADLCILNWFQQNFAVHSRQTLPIIKHCQPCTLCTCCWSEESRFQCQRTEPSWH